MLEKLNTESQAMGTALYEAQANEGATQADAPAGDDNVAKHWEQAAFVWPCMIARLIACSGLILFQSPSSSDSWSSRAVYAMLRRKRKLFCVFNKREK